jgi:tetratricopeptide (TPR) repeat protein
MYSGQTASVAAEVAGGVVDGWTLPPALALLPLGLAAIALGAQPPPVDLREAARLDGQGKCTESAPIYRRALSAGTPSTALLNNAGNHYLVCGDPAKAREYFELLAKRIPAHPNANLQLARLAVEQNRTALPFLRALATQDDPGLLAEAGAMYARLGEFKLAQQTLQRVVAARPGDFQGLWNLGRAAARAGDLARAREALEAALRIRPEDAGVLLELGAAHATAGEYPRAVFLLAQAQQRAPDQPAIALALARAAEDAGYHGDAAIAYDRYLTLRPDDSAARRDRARVVANTAGRREEGLKALEDYVARLPQDPLGHFHLAQLCWSTDADKSLAHLAEAVRLDPRFAPAHTARAWLLHRHGRDPEALTHLEAALASSPADVRALDQYGLVLVALDRAADAEKAFRKAAALAPSDWEVRLHLGRALMEQGRDQDARLWLDQYQKLRPARQRDPRREPGMIELATLPLAERRTREIERFYTMARSRPDDAVLRMHLGSLLLADGREAEAEKEFRLLSTLNADEQTLAQAGRTLLDAGRYEWALPFLERSGAALERAVAIFNTGGADKALAALTQVPVNKQSGEFLLLKARVLDSLGRPQEAGQLLAGSAAWKTTSPEIAEQAAELLGKHGLYRAAAQLLASTAEAAPGNRGLLLAEAIAVALDGRVTEAERRLRRIEERWPEWDKPYLAHGVMLEQVKRNRDAAQKFRTAAAIGSGNVGANCRSLRDWLSPSCRGGAR